MMIGSDSRARDVNRPSAVRAWTRYLNHASTKGRSDMAGKAEAQIAKLEDARKRLE